MTDDGDSSEQRNEAATHRSITLLGKPAKPAFEEIEVVLRLLVRIVARAALKGTNNEGEEEK